MSTHVRLTTASPEDNAASVPSTPLSEMFVAELFVKQYRYCICRIDDDEDDSSVFYAPNLCDNSDYGNVIPILRGGAIPDGFVVSKICELIAELTEHSDPFTKIRCGQYSFIAGVMEFLRRDPRLVVPKMRPASDEYDYARINEVVEKRREHRHQRRATA
jgi:hypothetical protein